MSGADQLRGTEFDEVMRPTPPRAPQEVPTVAVTHRRSGLSGRNSGMIALVAVALVAAAGVAWLLVVRPAPTKTLPPAVAEVIASAAQARPMAPAPTPLIAPSPPDVTPPSLPTPTPTPVAPEPPAAVATRTPSPALADADRYDTDKRYAALKNALANERAARVRAERQGGGTVTAVLADGVVVRDASGKERVLSVGQKVP